MSKLHNGAFAMINPEQSRLIAGLIAAAVALTTCMATAGPREDAIAYYQLAQREEQLTEQAGRNLDVAGVQYHGNLMLDYARKYKAAEAEYEQLNRQQGGGNTARSKVTGTRTQYYGTRGYGPERTGFEWKPFLADLRPKAVASQIRQGDNSAKQGNWDAAAKYYDQAARIDPKNQLARQKATEAHQKLNQAQSAAQQSPAQPPTSPSSQGITEPQSSIPPLSDKSKDGKESGFVGPQFLNKAPMDKEITAYRSAEREYQKHSTSENLKKFQLEIHKMVEQTTLDSP